MQEQDLQEIESKCLVIDYPNEVVGPLTKAEYDKYSDYLPTWATRAVESSETYKAYQDYENPNPFEPNPFRIIIVRDMIGDDPISLIPGRLEGGKFIASEYFSENDIQNKAPLALHKDGAGQSVSFELDNGKLTEEVLSRTVANLSPGIWDEGKVPDELTAPEQTAKVETPEDNAPNWQPRQEPGMLPLTPFAPIIENFQNPEGLDPFSRLSPPLLFNNRNLDDGMDPKNITAHEKQIAADEEPKRFDHVLYGVLENNDGVFLGENHSQPGIRQAVTYLIPALKARGVGTISYELPQDVITAALKAKSADELLYAYPSSLDKEDAEILFTLVQQADKYDIKVLGHEMPDEEWDKVIRTGVEHNKANPNFIRIRNDFLEEKAGDVDKLAVRDEFSAQYIRENRGEGKIIVIGGRAHSTDLTMEPMSKYKGLNVLLGIPSIDSMPTKEDAKQGLLLNAVGTPNRFLTNYVNSKAQELNAGDTLANIEVGSDYIAKLPVDIPEYMIDRIKPGEYNGRTWPPLEPKTTPDSSLYEMFLEQSPFNLERSAPPEPPSFEPLKNIPSIIDRPLIDLSPHELQRRRPTPDMPNIAPPFDVPRTRTLSPSVTPIIPGIPGNLPPSGKKNTDNSR